MITSHSADANTPALTSALPIKGHKRTKLKERTKQFVDQVRQSDDKDLPDFTSSPTSGLTSSLNPAHLQPAYSIPAKLLADPDAYSCPSSDMQQTTLYNIPEYWFLCIDKIRAECLTINTSSGSGLNSGPGPDPKPPGFHRTIACCIDLGFNHYILPNPDFQALATFQRQKLSLDHTISGVRIDGLNEFLSSFTATIPNNSSHARKRQNLYLPAWLNQQVSEFSLQLGPKLNSFIITSAIMLILSTQNCLFEAHKKRLMEGSKILLDNVKLRARLSEVVVQFIKEGKD